ncbi:hypothetical protein VFPPC_15476 [Pochonia chlamydosporia 170]|uniref:Uncharacterized protein n=1 Tax=Pochonia chlamydosporia 170 TaxID=1380566 RepID=A0A179FVT3_METCM|nr:hypothetical protein VFPPC_15476 [Pochonia chlamydosporia 170]OAQ69724.1 hypothetical protein VFPPC_15476 [Pochonia chlamydosporia 170]
MTTTRPRDQCVRRDADAHNQRPLIRERHSRWATIIMDNHGINVLPAPVAQGHIIIHLQSRRSSNQLPSRVSFFVVCATSTGQN